MKLIWRDTAVRHSLFIFLVMRLFFSLWALLALALFPLPETPDEGLRPYLGEPILDHGVPGALLGPWQRFDSNHYLRMAREGYTNEADSVFPPLYPFIIHLIGRLLGGSSVANLTAALFISNLACLGLFILLHKVVTAELGSQHATRTLVYLALFPTSFFLFAAYTEPLFILLALSAWWAARNGRFWLAGSLGFLASLTRLTGWVLVLPLVYEWWRREKDEGRRTKDEGRRAEDEGRRAKGEGRSPASPLAPRSSPLAFRSSLLAPHSSLLTLPPTLLPPLALGLFFLLRGWLGLPPIAEIYGRYWYQTTGFPGQDVITAVQTLFLGGPARANEWIALSLDFACLLLLVVTTWLSFRRLGTSYGLYAAMLLLFILLPTSDVKPLYSFSRYTLAFFPTFMLLGLAGERPNFNRLILYTSLLLSFFFSAQFFIWGWVA